jgi:hypothetical protein
MASRRGDTARRDVTGTSGAVIIAGMMEFLPSVTEVATGAHALDPFDFPFDVASPNSSRRSLRHHPALSSTG